MKTGLRLAVVGLEGANRDPFELARQLGLPLLPEESRPELTSAYDALLLVGAKGLSVQRTGPGAPGPVGVDFGSGRMRHRRSAGQNELLGRAVGVGRKPQLRVIDATAGLGQDSFVLADLGCTVLMCERDALIAALLESGLRQGRMVGDPWLDDVLARLRLWQGDATALPASELDGVDIIYLDPMFPPRNKRSAVKKEMALFQLLLSARDEDESLLPWALEQEVARVVVKRPLKSKYLGGCGPSHTITGRAVRYDVYVKRALD